MMKKAVLSRYQKTDDGKIVVDVSVGEVQDLYEDFDRTAPYVKKDLDQDFADYLVECVREIGRRAFVIRIDLLKHQDEALMERVRRSIYTYFVYLRELEKRAIGAMFRKSFILFTIGFALAFSAVIANRAFAESSSVTGEVLREGLTIAAWVSLWEAVAYVLLEWHPHRQNIRIYRRIETASLVFRFLNRDE